MPPTKQARRLLVLCHLAAVENAITTVRAWSEAGQEADIDVLAYGRSHDTLPAPAGARLVRLPEWAVPLPTRLVKSARFVRDLRRRRYDIAVIGQPSLRLSRARGLLLSFPLVIGAGRTVVLDPLGSRGPRRVRPIAALADLIGWLVLHTAATLLAPCAAAVVSKLGGRPPAPPASLPDRGSVLYLRSDLDLAVAPLLAGGSAAHTDGVIRAMRRRGYDVSLWTTGEVAGVPSEVPQRRLPALVRGNLPIEIGELLSGLLQAVRSVGPERPTAFVYQRYSLNNLAGLAMARRWGVPLLLEANASEASWRRDWSALTYGRLADACEQLLLSRADHIVTVSENAARGLIQAGADPERLSVIPNGVEVEQFADADPIEGIFGKDHVVFCFSGLFYPWHGARYLAEAFVLLRRRRPEARLLLVGDGEELPLVRSILEAGEALGAVHTAGLVPRDKVPRYLAAADVLVSPHAPGEDFVGSPVKIFEYMAAGRALVVSHVAQMGEILRDGETALLPPPGDPNALASCLEHLFDNDALRERLGHAAQAEARRSHSWDARLDQLLTEAG